MQIKNPNIIIVVLITNTTYDINLQGNPKTGQPKNRTINFIFSFSETNSIESPLTVIIIIIKSSFSYPLIKKFLALVPIFTAV